MIETIYNRRYIVRSVIRIANRGIGNVEPIKIILPDDYYGEWALSSSSDRLLEMLYN